MDLDLDLDLDGMPGAATPAHLEATQPIKPTATHDDEHAFTLPTAPAPAYSHSLPPAPAPSPASTAAVAALALDDHDAHDAMSMDFSLPQVPELHTPAPLPGMEPSGFDLSDISLDLDMPPPSAHPPSAAHAEPSGFGELSLDEPGDLHGEDDPISRKLDLAEEFRQIGDTDGARDLLNEVVAKSTGAVKSRVQSMLADLG